MTLRFSTPIEVPDIGDLTRSQVALRVAAAVSYEEYLTENGLARLRSETLLRSRCSPLTRSRKQFQSILPGRFCISANMRPKFNYILSYLRVSQLQVVTRMKSRSQSGLETYSRARMERL